MKGWEDFGNKETTMRSNIRLLPPVTTLAAILVFAVSLFFVGCTEKNSMPEEVRKVIFGDGSKFSTSITLQVPCADSAETIETYRKRLPPPGRTFQGIGPVGPGNVYDLGPKLDFLKATGFARVETWHYPTSLPNRYDFLLYTGRPPPCPIIEGSVSNCQRPGFTMLLGERQLKEITYVNRFKNTSPFGGPEVDVFATTFTYTLEWKCPEMPPIEQLFEGKGEAYLDPSDGKWKLKSETLADGGLQEFLRAAKAIVVKETTAKDDSVGTPKAEDNAAQEQRRGELNVEFDTLVRDTSMSVGTKLEQIDAMRSKGFSLNDPGTKHVSSPMDSLISFGTPDLVSALLARGLKLNASIRYCQDQYWFTQGALLRPGGLDVLRVLVDAGFRDDCLREGRSMSGGVVCGVAFGWGTKEFNVTKAVEAVDFLAARDFPVNVKCLGKTLPEQIDSTKDPELRQRLAPIAEAVRRHAGDQ